MTLAERVSAGTYTHLQNTYLYIPMRETIQCRCRPRDKVCMAEMPPYSSHLSGRQSPFYNMVTRCFQKSMVYTHQQSFRQGSNSSGIDRGPQVKRCTRKVAKALEKVAKLL